jgi:hypothetical protein
MVTVSCPSSNGSNTNTRSKDGNTSFQQAYQVLSSSEKDIAIDVLTGKTAQWIESHGVAAGTADRR